MCHAIGVARMGELKRPGSKLYRLEMEGDGPGSPRVIEFEAEGPEAALLAIERHAGGRVAGVFENGRPLGSVRQAAEHGFWTIAPGPRAAT